MLVATTGLAAGCGGERQDKNEPSGSYPVRVLPSAFPRLQGLAETLPFRVIVTNIGDKAIPNVAVTVDGFYDRTTQPDVADPLRPVWIVNRGPTGGVTAYNGTWTGGTLAPGATKIFKWSVTATVAGTHTLRYRVAAGTDGKARAVTANDTVPEGAVTVRVTRRPRISYVDPKTGQVITKGQ